MSHMRKLRRLFLLLVLATVTTSVYVSLDNNPILRQPNATDKQRAEAIRKKSAQTGQDIDSPKKILTPEEIEAGKW